MRHNTSQKCSSGGSHMGNNFACGLTSYKSHNGLNDIYQGSYHGPFYKVHHVSSHALPNNAHHGICSNSYHVISHKGHHNKATSHQENSHLGSPHQAEQPSLGHGCAIGSGNQVRSFGRQRHGWKNGGLFSFNEKETMKLLNDRLSSYLDQVSLVEEENARLERKMSEWYENNPPDSLPDSGQFFTTIEDLQKQIATATSEKSRIVVKIDNAKWAADDFRNKYEVELRLRSNAESDVRAASRILEDLNREKYDLEVQLQCLQEELQEIKRNHEEEVKSLQAQLGTRVNVEVNTSPSVDLNKVLSEIREQYETMMERNMNEIEKMFLERSEELNNQVALGSNELQSFECKVIELKRVMQTLEIDLQTQLSMQLALENTLADTKATYGSQLSQLQELINKVEDQLAHVRSALKRQNYEYCVLVDLKSLLEMEIATYKRLLEEQEQDNQCTNEEPPLAPSTPEETQPELDPVPEPAGPEPEEKENAPSVCGE